MSWNYSWDANMGIQSVFNYYKTVIITNKRSESECLLAIKQAVRNAFSKELNNYEQLKSVASAYISKR